MAKKSLASRQAEWLQRKMSKQELLMATGSRLEKPASPVRASAAAAGRARHNILQTARVGKTVVVQSHRRDLR